MRRRDFITLLGGAAAAWPLAARAQQVSVPVVGFVRSTSAADSTHLVTAFRQGLKEAGFVEGQNVAVEYRWADNQFDRLPALVADLLHRPVVVIVGNFNSALAAKAATTTVPIVFTTGGDPISDGLVSSLNRPGGNVTGINFLGGVLGAKRLDLLRQIAPKAITIGVLVNRTAPIPKRSEETCRPWRRRSGSNSSFSMSAATATSRWPFQRSSNAELARCWSVAARS